MTAIEEYCSSPSTLLTVSMLLGRCRSSGQTSCRGESTRMCCVPLQRVEAGSRKVVCDLSVRVSRPATIGATGVRSVRYRVGRFTDDIHTPIRVGDGYGEEACWWDG